MSSLSKEFNHSSLLGAEEQEEENEDSAADEAKGEQNAPTVSLNIIVHLPWNSTSRAPCGMTGTD
jgi:hypothetical protein